MQTRNTVQKTIVAEALRALANHPTADEVYAAVHTEHPSISKATVYRILNKLAEEGLAQKVLINNGADRFDHQTFPHYHVRCSCCGRVDDVILPQSETFIAQAAHASAYRITTCSVQFDGICPTCAAAKEKEDVA